MRYLIKTVFLMLVLVFTSSCASSGAVQFQNQLDVYIRTKIDRDYAALWSGSSARFKESNGNDQQEFAANLTAFGAYPANITVLKTSRHGANAEVRVKVQYSEEDGASAGSAVEEWRFVEEEGKWRFDGYKTLSESPP